MGEWDIGNRKTLWLQPNFFNVLCYYVAQKEKVSYSMKSYFRVCMTDDTNSPQIIKWLKQGWLFIAQFIGAVVLITQAVELWRGDVELVTWVIIGLGYAIVVSTTGYIAYARRPTQFTPSGLYPHFPKSYKIARFFLWVIVIIPMFMGIVLFINSKTYSQDYDPKSDEPCPGRQNTGDGVEIPIQVNVQRGDVAYITGWEFDNVDGGFFVTIKGPYNKTHNVRSGAYCPSIPANSELSRKTFAMLKEECDKNKNGCSKTKTCAQNIFEYYFHGGECHE